MSVFATCVFIVIFVVLILACMKISELQNELNGADIRITELEYKNKQIYVEVK